MSDIATEWLLWNDKFQAINESLSISELNGLVLGMLCVTQAPTEEQWRQILALLKMPSLDDDSIAFLTEEADDICHILADGDLDYLPILPDDEQPLLQRVQALSDWCSGVVLGFSLATQQITDEEGEQIEILQDIAAVEFSDSDDDEEGEQAYQELYELVRLIPIHLSMGRPNKLSVVDIALLKPKSKHDKSSHIVEMYNPNLPN